MALPFFNKKMHQKMKQEQLFFRNSCRSMSASSWTETDGGQPNVVCHEVWTSGRSKKFQRPVPVLSGYWSAKCIFYVFSTENWKRPQDEVNAIMDLFWDYLCEADQYLERRVRMIFVGDRSRLQDRLQKRMEELEHDSRDFEKMNLILAINYGGRDEIKHAAQEIAKEVQAGKLAPEAITEQTISEHLYTAGFRMWIC